MASLEARSDSALFAVTQKCQDGMPEIFDRFFGFLARKTDFFDGKSHQECERDVMKAFDNHCAKIDEIMRQRRIQREQEEVRQRKLARQQRELKKAKEEVDKQANSELMLPNEGMGCDLPGYKWTQTPEKIELTVPFNVDFTIKSRDVCIDFKKTHLKVGLKGLEPIINSDLFGEIVVDDDTTWSLTEKNVVNIVLKKKSKAKLWNKLVVTDPEINIKQ